jgi:hypothetical protein
VVDTDSVRPNSDQDEETFAAERLDIVAQIEECVAPATTAEYSASNRPMLPNTPDCGAKPDDSSYIR